ncbi:MAG: hypothetical protein B7Z45_03500 [Azorhizobium sp. 12-66-6]|nr:MAG: hypothetical protein B7Z45_03500 [Azorhizobium sp. 12-66-6]
MERQHRLRRRDQLRFRRRRSGQCRGHRPLHLTGLRGAGGVRRARQRCGLSVDHRYGTTDFGLEHFFFESKLSRTVDGAIPLSTPGTSHQEVSFADRALEPAPPEGCPPPLRCRQIAAALDELASPWEVAGSPLGTHGWCWGSGPPLYFLNPLGGSARVFTLAAWLLREDFRCVMIDWNPPLRGQPADLDAFAADFRSLADSADDQGITVFGGSFGGAVALKAAASAPGLIDRLIVQDVRVHQKLSWSELALAYAGRRSQRTVRQLPFSGKVQRLNHARWFPPLDAERWEWFLELIGDFPASLLATQALALHHADLSLELGKVGCPVLVLDTEGAGPQARVEQALLRKMLPRGHAASLHTTGLYPYLTHPHRLVKLVRQFVSDPDSLDGPSPVPEFFPLKPS